MQERWELYRVTYVIARFLALNGVASIEVRASGLHTCSQDSGFQHPVTRCQHSSQRLTPLAATAPCTVKAT